MAKKEITPLVHIDYNLVDTTFDKFTDFSGELVFEHSLKINGRFQGTIKSDGFLYVGKTAVLEADIEAGVVIIEGEIKGNVIALDKVEMMSTAKLFGDLKTAKLQISDGVVFEGNCEMIKPRQKTPEVSGNETAPKHTVKI